MELLTYKHNVDRILDCYIGYKILRKLSFWTLTSGYSILLKGIALKPIKEKVAKNTIEFERSGHADRENKQSPWYLLAIPSEELAVVLSLCVVDDVQ